MPEPAVNNAAEPATAAAAPIQYDSWDEKGNPIVTKQSVPKPEEAAASAAPAKEAQSESAKADETVAEPEAAEEPQKPQRKPGEKLSAGEELGKLRKELRELREWKERTERERSREPEPKPAAAKAEPAQPQNYAEWSKQFKASAWMEEYAKANPTASYEDALSACTDFKAEVRDQFRQFEKAQADSMEKTKGMLDKTAERYPDAKEKITQSLGKLAEAPPFVQAFLNDSDVTTDLLYALSDPTTLSNLMETARTNPGKALRALHSMELDIQKAATAPEEKPEPKAKVETKPRAPEPPVIVGGKGSAAEDAVVSAARSGDFRSFDAEMKRRHFTSK